MEKEIGYKNMYEKKEQRLCLYFRMDDTMLNGLRQIRKRTGISVSEVIREAIRRLLNDIEEKGSFNLKVD
jgi:predicted DNA-binding protein